MSDNSRAVAAGHRARSELEQTEAAFARVYQATVVALIQTAPGQEAKRERLIVTCQILDAVRKVLRDVIDDGMMAEAALAQENLLRP